MFSFLADSFYSIAVKTLNSALLLPTTFLYAADTIFLSSFDNSPSPSINFPFFFIII